jgi:hypothetical protein
VRKKKKGEKRQHIGRILALIGFFDATFQTISQIENKGIHRRDQTKIPVFPGKEKKRLRI